MRASSWRCSSRRRRTRTRSWGYFATAFEQKEYVEAYVAEQYGRELLEKDPALKAEFYRKLATRPRIRAGPEGALDFFIATNRPGT